MGTKLVNDSFIHVCMKEASIPETSGNFAALADFLASVISLKRMAMMNFNAIELMVSAHVKDKVDFLKEHENSSILYRENSSGLSTLSGTSATTYNFNWEEDERKRRIMEDIENTMLKFYSEDADLYISSTWESIAFN